MCPQTQSPTSEGYGELGKLSAGEAANVYGKICCLKTACTANESQTSSGVTKSTESGLTMATANTVASSTTTYANDTVQVNHVFTAGEGAVVLGFGVWNTIPDVLFALCCFNAAQTLETTDTLTVQMKVQYKLGT